MNGLLGPCQPNVLQDASGAMWTVSILVGGWPRCRVRKNGLMIDKKRLCLMCSRTEALVMVLS